jgi:hypothetical protein
MINICNGTTKLDISADDDSLLVGAFDRPKPHVRPDHRFANHPRIRGVVLPTLDIRLHVTGGHQLYRMPETLSVRARPRRCCADVTPDHSFGAGQDIIEVLTKCLVQHLSGGDVCFDAAWGEQAATVRESPIRGPPGQTRRQLAIENAIQSEDSLMCVVPSIIVLLVTALVVFRRELTAPPAAPASKHPPIATRSKRPRRV